MIHIAASARADVTPLISDAYHFDMPPMPFRREAEERDQTLPLAYDDYAAAA